MRAILTAFGIVLAIAVGVIPAIYLIGPWIVVFKIMNH
jgi:hypothetical protein